MKSFFRYCQKLAFFSIIFFLPILGIIFQLADKVPSNKNILQNPLFGLFNLLFCLSALSLIQSLFSTWKETRTLFELEHTEKSLLVLQQQQESLNSLHEDIQNRQEYIYNNLELAYRQGSKGDYDKMSQIISNLSAYVNENRLETFCRDSLLNTLLKIKKSIAQKSKISCDFQVILPDHFSQRFLDTDITSLFSNLLDNGIEAAKNSPKGWIKLKVNYHASLFLIQMENSKNSEVVFEHQTTKKKNTQIHGYGLSIIEEIVTRYHGECQWTDNGDSFVSRITMYLPKFTTEEEEKL